MEPNDTIVYVPPHKRIEPNDTIVYVPPHKRIEPNDTIVYVPPHKRIEPNDTIVYVPPHKRMEQMEQMEPDDIVVYVPPNYYNPLREYEELSNEIFVESKKELEKLAFYELWDGICIDFGVIKSTN
jgi:hypothetical protein